MRLQTMILINRAPFEKLHLNFSTDNVTVLAGVNGAGKTTVLSYVVDAFFELAKNAFSNEFEDKANKYYRIASGLYTLDSKKPSIVYLRFTNEDGNNIDYVDIAGKCTNGTYDEIIDFSNKISYSEIESELEQSNFVKRWSKIEKEEISKIFNGNLLTYFPAYRYEVPSFLNDPYKFELSFTKKMHFTGYLSNPIEVTNDLPDIANWIMDIVLDHELYHGEASVVFIQLNELLSKMLNSKLNCNTRLGIGPRTSGASRIAVMDRDKNEQIYPSIFGMSSGELAMLCLFGELIKQTDKIGKLIQDITGIVLVDEIDKHLHIRLQKDILPKLINMFPKVQFIVTSHSPFLGLGLSENADLSYTIYDLDNDGITCPPQDNELFKEVYEMMIKQNEQYYLQYKNLQKTIKDNAKPLIITEGKTDWKHLKAAMRKLSITDLDIDIYEYEDEFGDSKLESLLLNFSKFHQPRRIIGIFDRDNTNSLKNINLSSSEYIQLDNNVYAFAIPLVNEDIYGKKISIEHYYKKEDLTQKNNEGKRLFLGEEFYERGLSKNSKYITRCKGIDKKSKHNGIIDDSVFVVNEDPEEKISVALKKNDFAELVLKDEEFAKGFDFSKFQEIFNVIRKIVKL